MGNKLSVKRFKSKNSKAKEAAKTAAAAPQTENHIEENLQIPQVTVTTSTIDRLSPQVAVPVAQPTVLELYTRGVCPFTEQVRTALTYKNVEFKLVTLTEDPEWFKTASPEGTVPGKFKC